MRIVVAGSGPNASKVFEAFEDSRHTVVGLIQNGRSFFRTKKFVGRLLAPFLVPPEHPLRRAYHGNIPIIWIRNQDASEVSILYSLSPDIVISSGINIIFRSPVIEIPECGFINIHSSLLPKHRGPTPVTAAILAGDTTTGVTVHFVDSGIDTGDIIAQYSVPIAPEDTYQVIADKIAMTVRENLENVINQIEHGTCSRRQQSGEEATYDPKLSDRDRMIDWSWEPEKISRLVRACVPPNYALARVPRRLVHVKTITFFENAQSECEVTFMKEDSHLSVVGPWGSAKLSVCSPAMSHLLHILRQFDLTI